MWNAGKKYYKLQKGFETAAREQNEIATRNTAPKHVLEKFTL